MFKRAVLVHVSALNVDARGDFRHTQQVPNSSTSV